MSINTKDFQFDIVRAALQDIGLWSLSAENLLMMTAATESYLGQYLKQYPRGPAFGAYQQEEISYFGFWKYVYPKQSEIRKIHLKRYNITNKPNERERLIYDLRFATILCRMHYWRFEEPLPNHDNLYELAVYYKKYWNTEKGKGSIEKAIHDYKQLVL